MFSFQFLQIGLSDNRLSAQRGVHPDFSAVNRLSLSTSRSFAGFGLRRLRAAVAVDEDSKRLVIPFMVGLWVRFFGVIL